MKVETAELETGQLGQNSQDRTVGTGTAETGQLVEDNWTG
jgi:hypothetical protein